MYSRIDVLLTKHYYEDSARTPLYNLTDMMTEPLTFSSVAQGGYATATVVITCSQEFAEDLLGMHLGRRIVCINPDVSTNTLSICWEGQISNVTVSDGRVSVSRSIQDVYNSVRVQYTQAVTIGSTYYEGETTTTLSSVDPDSNERFGTRQLIQTAGVLTDTVATAFRDRLKADFAWPRSVASSSSIGGGAPDGQVTARIECVGWAEQLSKTLEGPNTTTTTYSTHTILASIYPPASNFDDADTSNIQSVGAPGFIRAHEDYMSTMDYINTLTAAGSSSGTRCYFGVYEYARPYFHAEASTPRYYISIGDQSERVYDATLGRFVPPWDIRPGFPAIIVDFLTNNATTYTSIFNNPRVFVIGTVDFTAPNTVSLSPLSTEAGALTLARMDWYSQTLPFTMIRLDGPPTPWQPIPGTGPLPPWWNDDPNLPIPLDPGQTPPGWRQPYVGVPDPSQILPPLPPRNPDLGPIPDP